MHKLKRTILPFLLAVILALSGCENLTPQQQAAIDLSSLPEYSGQAYVELNNNVPFFTEEDLTSASFEEYSPLDELGRCGTAYACISTDLMPTEPRGSIGQVKPSGWKIAKYDFVDGKYLYNRCHLIGFQLTGENANEQNLITGTRYLNVTGMLPFENLTADYLKETGNHVLYRVTPVFTGDELVARGFANIAIPGLSKLPVVGEGLFHHNLLVYLGVVIAVAMWWYLNRTTPGLRLRAVGENPGAADSVGVNVKRCKYIHICIGCGIMGLGGYYMGLNMSGSFSSSCWINGYGWIAVALVIFANWNPAMAILGTFVFGFFNTLRVSGGGLAAAFPGALGWLAGIPSQLYQALPFIITALVLVGSSMKKTSNSGAPAALGANYFREER